MVTTTHKALSYFASLISPFVGLVLFILFRKSDDIEKRRLGNTSFIISISAVLFVVLGSTAVYLTFAFVVTHSI